MRPLNRPPSQYTLQLHIIKYQRKTKQYSSVNTVSLVGRFLRTYERGHIILSEIRDTRCGSPASGEIPVRLATLQTGLGRAADYLSVEASSASRSSIRELLEAHER